VIMVIGLKITNVSNAIRITSILARVA
jgi:hypothetical protein